MKASYCILCVWVFCLHVRPSVHHMHAGAETRRGVGLPCWVLRPKSSERESSQCSRLLSHLHLAGSPSLHSLLGTWGTDLRSSGLAPNITFTPWVISPNIFVLETNQFHFFYNILQLNSSSRTPLPKQFARHLFYSGSKRFPVS